MKFKLVKVGEVFEFEGKQFVKTSPVVATCQQSGEQKLIRRSTDVIPAESQPKQKPIFKTRQLSRSDVRIAFNNFYTECENCLHDMAPSVDEQLLSRLEEKLEKAKNSFLAKIG